MALFPSCSSQPLFPSAPEEASTSREKVTATELSWLDNTSFKEPPPEPATAAATAAGPSSPLPPDAKRRKKKQQHKKAEKESISTAPAKPNTIWLEESGLDLKDAYRVDRHPDAGNLQYSGLYSGDVALYKRRFGAQCIGQPDDVKMEWTDGRGKALKEKKTTKPSRYYFSGQISKEVVLQPTTTTTSQRSIDESLGYLPFRQELPDMASEDDAVSNVLTVEKYISQRTAEYNRNLLDDPHDIELWIEFVGFQDSARLWSGKDAATKSTPALLERKVSILERALQSNPTSVELLVQHMALVGRIWEYAATMKKWKDIVFIHPNKPLLWLHYIQFCQSNFSTFSASSLTSLYSKCISTLTSIQEGSLKSHKPEKDTPKYLLAIFTLCCHFLRQIGQTEKAVACYQALIEFNLCSPPELDADAGNMTTSSRLEFFEAFWDSDVARFGEQGALGWAGWTKQAQSGAGSAASNCSGLGLLDNPPSLHAPEVGVTEAKRKEEEEEEEEEEDPEIKMLSGLPLDQAWLKLESHRSTSDQSLPWRPGPNESAEDCIDPDRMVLFDDVKQYMFRVTDPALQFELVLGFLHFLGAAGVTSSPLLSPTPALVSQWLEHPEEVFTFDSNSLDGFLHYGRSIPQPVHCLHRSLGYSVGGYKPLASGSVSELARSVSLPEPLLTDPAVSRLVSGVCNQALSLLSDPDSQTSLAEVWVVSQTSLMSPHNPIATKQSKARVKALQKLVKRLLKLDVFRSSFRLWNCYALLEHTLGNYSDAIKIYQTILVQYHSVSMQQPHITLLYRCMCECLVPLSPHSHHSPQPPRHQEALNTLVCLTEVAYSPLQDGSKVTPGRILRARSCYRQEEYEASPRKDLNYVLCHALFEYLSANLQSACAVLDRAIEVLSSGPLSSPGELRELETIYRWQARLIEQHSAVQPAILRKTLQNALTLFPNNAWFLSAFIDSESDSFISGRLRRFFDSRAPSAVTAVPWLCAVLSELKRYARLRRVSSQPDDMGGGEGGGGGGGGECVVEEPVTGTVHRIRALLTRATDSECGRLCPLLWRLRMAMEQDEKKVKAVFYQAIQQCPSAKVLYLDVVSLVPQELSKVLEMLEEKELRIRAPLEEVKLLLSACK